VSERHWLDITVAEYHEHQAISSGAVRCLIKDGPLDFYWQYIARKGDREESIAKLNGQLFHRAMEVPDEWESEVLVSPECYQDDEAYEAVVTVLKGSGFTGHVPAVGEELNRRTKATQMYLEMWNANAVESGKTLIDAAQLEAIKWQIQAVFDNPAFAESGLLGGKTEAAVVTKCHESGLDIKGLLDLYEEQAFLDWKTTRRRTNADFWRDFDRLMYGNQIAHYRYVSGITRHYIGTVTNAAPYEAQLYEIKWSTIQELHEQNILRLKEVAGLLRQWQPDDDTDSFGIPLVFHSNGWGRCIESTELSGEEPEWQTM
jgi:hypothetical protein